MEYDTTRFVQVYNGNALTREGRVGCQCTIVVDRATGVNYLICGSGMTVLIDASGRPIVSREHTQR